MLSTPPNTKDITFEEVIGLLNDLQLYKGTRYGNSWCKHGEAISIFGNIARKYDRIETMIRDFVENKRPLPSPLSEESIAETVGDLAVYCVLWMTWIKENRQEEYEAWKNRIEKLRGPAWRAEESKNSKIW